MDASDSGNSRGRASSREKVQLVIEEDINNPEQPAPKEKPASPRIIVDDDDPEYIDDDEEDPDDDLEI